MRFTLHTRRVWQLIAIAGMTLALDQFSKYWLLYHVGLIDRPPVELSEYFSLVMVWNHGISFGMLAHSNHDFTPYLLIVLALLISGFLVRLALATESRWERLGYGMVIGGALGNALDRARLGAVADFFYAHIGALGWPAFNVADSAICLGVCLLLLTMMRASKVRA